MLCKINSGNFSALQYVNVNSVNENTGSCSISENGESVVFQSENPYPDRDHCHYEFNCPDNHFISYQLNRFDIEPQTNCYADYLGINCILLCRIIYKIF